MKKVPIPLILLFVFLYWSRELDKKTIHGHTWDEPRINIEKSDFKKKTNQDRINDSIRAERLKELGILPDDSLERMYDRNYMDFDLYNNPDDDDEWHDYFND